MRTKAYSLIVAALLFGASDAAAQVVWDSPLLAVPSPETGYGFYLFDPAGAGLGLLGTWRGSGPIRFHFGLADGDPFDNIALVGGGAYTRLLRGPTQDFPLEVGWHLGLGVGYSEWLTVSIPFGASFGLPIDTEGLTLLPFVAPRVVVDGRFGDVVDEGTDLDFAADLGLDARVGPTWGLRFAATLGDREGLAIGIVF